MCVCASGWSVFQCVHVLSWSCLLQHHAWVQHQNESLPVLRRQCDTHIIWYLLCNCWQYIWHFCCRLKVSYDEPWAPVTDTLLPELWLFHRTDFWCSVMSWSSHWFDSCGHICWSCQHCQSNLIKPYPHTSWWRRVLSWQIIRMLFPQNITKT